MISVGKTSAAYDKFKKKLETVQHLQEDVTEYITRLFSSGNLTEQQSEQTAGLLYVTNNIQRLAELCQDIDGIWDQIESKGMKLSATANEELGNCIAITWDLLNQAMEAVKEGIQIYENPLGVLTNNPPFPYHQMNLRNYLNLTTNPPANRFCQGVELETYGEGMGAMGLPGDASPASRFVKAAFLKWNSASDKEETANLSQFFHILDNVSMVRGAVVTDSGKYDITTYSCCVNVRTGVYYYKTYENARIQAVDMRAEDLDGQDVAVYELEKHEEIRYHNR